MITKAIFYLHHRNDAFTKWNFLKYKQLNPTWDVIPVGFDEFTLLSESVRVRKDKYPSNEQLIFDYPIKLACADVDLLFYDSYFQRPSYEKYFFVEYDTVANVGVDKFFPAVETFEFFGGNAYCIKGSKWEFVKLYRKYGGKEQKLASCGQTTCIFFTNKIIKQVSEEVVRNKDLYNDMLSELRCGTITRKFTRIRRPYKYIGKFLSWNKNDLQSGHKEYFYHPIKTFKEWDELNNV